MIRPPARARPRGIGWMCAVGANGDTAMRQKKLRLSDRARLYARRRMREEGADNYGVSASDVGLVPSWIRKAWIDGYRAGKRRGKIR